LEPLSGHFCLSRIERERKVRLGNISVTMDTENDDVVDAHRETSFMHFFYQQTTFMHVFMCIQKAMMKLWWNNG